jgi:hypothetical protein
VSRNAGSSVSTAWTHSCLYIRFANRVLANHFLIWLAIWLSCVANGLIWPNYKVYNKTCHKQNSIHEVSYEFNVNCVVFISDVEWYTRQHRSYCASRLKSSLCIQVTLIILMALKGGQIIKEDTVLGHSCGLAKHAL